MQPGTLARAAYHLRSNWRRCPGLSEFGGLWIRTATSTRYELIAKIDMIEDIKEVSKNRHGEIFSDADVFLYPNIGLKVGLAAQ